MCIKQRSRETGQCNKVGRRTCISSMENVVLGRCMGIINTEARILKILLENKVSISLEQKASESLARKFWFWDYNCYPFVEDSGCSFDLAIYFHSVDPTAVYVLEYFIIFIHMAVCIGSDLPCLRLD